MALNDIPDINRARYAFWGDSAAELATLVAANAAGVTAATLLGNAPYAPLSHAQTFEITAFMKVVSQVNFATFTFTTSRYFAAGRGTDTTAQNNELVLSLPSPLMGGTWTLVLLHSTISSNGIYTIATSPDGAAFTDLTTIDGYSASTVQGVRTEVAGLTIPAATLYLRMRMATKNASSSAFGALWSGISGLRTGA